MRLTIYTLWGRTIEMHVEPHYFIGRIRTFLASSEGIPVDMLRLTRSREILEDSRSLSQLGESPWFFLQVKMIILVCISTGKTIVLDVWDGDTIANVKDKIQDHEGIHTEAQRISFAGQWVQNHHTLSYYWIRQGATLHCNLIIAIEVQSAQASSSQ